MAAKAASHPVRVSDGLFQEAKDVASRHSRSAAQQLEHWARLGRAFESSATGRETAAVLAGEEPFDTASERAQDAVVAAWDERMEEAITRLDLRESFAAQGRSWVDLDESGELRFHSA